MRKVIGLLSTRAILIKPHNIAYSHTLPPPDGEDPKASIEAGLYRPRLQSSGLERRGAKPTDDLI